MSEDEEMKKLIEERFRSFPWYGAAPLEEAIQGRKPYRRELSDEARALFDTGVRRGRHPSLVVETVEIVSGCLLPKGEERRRKHIASAS